MASTLGLGLGVVLTLLAVVLHVVRGSGWEPAADISDEVLEQRAETVPDTEFPEPMNRSLGGGGLPAGAAAAGEAGELAEGEGEAAAEEEGPWALPDDEADSFEIEYAKEGATIEVAENEHLLAAGEEEGWDLPYACREGQCISCGAQITDGPATDFVVHDGNQMLGEAELDEGFVLTCCAYPQDDFTLETRETP